MFQWGSACALSFTLFSSSFLDLTLKINITCSFPPFAPFFLSKLCARVRVCVCVCICADKSRPRKKRSQNAHNNRDSPRRDNGLSWKKKKSEQRIEIKTSSAKNHEEPRRDATIINGMLYDELGWFKACVCIFSFLIWQLLYCSNVYWENE